MSVGEGVALSACLWAPVFLAGCAASLSRPLDILSGSALLGPAGAAACVAALAAAAQLALLPREFSLVLGPPWIGAAPWLAGEMVAGPSRRQDEAFAAALVAAYGAALVATCAGARTLGEALATAAAATVAYLSVRGGRCAAEGGNDAG